MHNKIIPSSDGKYQVDVYLEFTLAGLRFRVLCECKRYKNRVSREKVELLHSRLESVAAQKGVLISTSDFQSGAIQYAKAHGIALIKVEDYHFEFLSHSSEGMAAEDDPFLYAEKNMPPYVAYDCTAESEKLCKVFPSSTTIRKLLIEQKKKIEEVMGIEADFPEINERVD